MDLERHTRIYKDVLYEVSPEDSVLTYDEDDLRVRGALAREVAEIVAAGMIPDIPSEWPDVTAEDVEQARQRWGDGATE